MGPTEWGSDRVINVAGGICQPAMTGKFKERNFIVLQHLYILYITS